MIIIAIGIGLLMGSERCAKDSTNRPRIPRIENSYANKLPTEHAVNYNDCKDDNQQQRIAPHISTKRPNKKSKTKTARETRISVLLHWSSRVEKKDNERKR